MKVGMIYSVAILAVVGLYGVQMIGHERAEERVPLTFSAPFPVTPFENAQKFCITIFELAKEFDHSRHEFSPFAHKIVDASALLYAATQEMLQMHSKRQLRCDDVEYLLQMLQGIDSILTDITRVQKNDLVGCAQVLCQKTQQRLNLFLDMVDELGCIASF